MEVKMKGPNIRVVRRAGNSLAVTVPSWWAKEGELVTYAKITKDEIVIRKVNINVPRILAPED